MENILQPVLESYPKFFIQKQKSPSYVQMYSKSNNDIAIVYVKVNVYNIFYPLIFM